MAVRRMKKTSRPARVPVSVAIAERERQRLEVEARRRGLGLSPTIRTLALERLAEIDDERERSAGATRPRRFLSEAAGRSGHHDTARRIEEILQEAFRK